MLPVICFVVFASFIGAGIVVPLFPFFGARIGAPPEAITSLIAVFALGQLVGTPLWGWASDRVGRRPIVLLCLAGSAASSVILAYADTLELLFASRIAGGLMAAVAAVAFAVVSDVATGNARARGMGFVGASMALGFILGPALGGLLAGGDEARADYRLIALVAAGLDAAAFVLAALFLRETRPPARRRHTDAGTGVPATSAFRRTLSHPSLLELNIANVLFSGSFAVVDAALPLFAARVHELSPREVGYMFTMMGSVSTATQAVGLAIFLRRLGAFGTVMLGIGCFVVGHIVVGLSPATWVMCIGAAILALGLGGVMAPSSSLVSAVAAEHERGALLGIFQGSGNLGRTLMPFFAGWLYAALGPPSPFLAAAAVSVPALVLVARAGRAHAVPAPHRSPGGL